MGSCTSITMAFCFEISAVTGWYKIEAGIVLHVTEND
jgi:hypothetical protein